MIASLTGAVTNWILLILRVFILFKCLIWWCWNDSHTFLRCRDKPTPLPHADCSTDWRLFSLIVDSVFSCKQRHERDFDKNIADCLDCWRNNTDKWQIKMCIWKQISFSLISGCGTGTSNTEVDSKEGGSLKSTKDLVNEDAHTWPNCHRVRMSFARAPEQIEFMFFFLNRPVCIWFCSGNFLCA